MILVTGGAGFIGSHTVEALIAAGERVRVLDDFSSGRRDNLPGSALLEIVEGDVRDPAAVQRAMEGVTRVLHLAAQVSVVRSIEDPVTSAAVNVGGFLVVLDAARRAGIGRFVYASSAAVYGMPDGLPLDESAPARPQSPYGLEKSVDDQYAALFAELYGMQCLGLRYFNVYGPRQDPASPYAGVIGRFIDCMRAGRPLCIFGDGEQTRDFVYVSDAGKVNVRALASTATGVCNVGTGHSASLLEVAKLLGEVSGRRLQIDHGPARAGDVRHSATSTARLREIMGDLQPVSLQDGVRALLRAEGVI